MNLQINVTLVCYHPFYNLHNECPKGQFRLGSPDWEITHLNLYLRLDKKA